MQQFTRTSTSIRANYVYFTYFESVISKENNCRYVFFFCPVSQRWARLTPASRVPSLVKNARG